MKKYLLLFFSILLISGINAEESWEGNATTAREGLFETEGFFVLSNSFNDNTEITVENLDTGARTEVTVVDRIMYNMDFFLLLSQKAAQALGMVRGEVARVKVQMYKEPELVAAQLPAELPFSPDPDVNPSVDIKDEKVDDFAPIPAKADAVEEIAAKDSEFVSDEDVEDVVEDVEDVVEDVEDVSEDVSQITDEEQSSSVDVDAEPTETAVSEVTVAEAETTIEDVPSPVEETEEKEIPPDVDVDAEPLEIPSIEARPLATIETLSIEVPDLSTDEEEELASPEIEEPSPAPLETLPVAPEITPIAEEASAITESLELLQPQEERSESLTSTLEKPLFELLISDTPSASDAMEDTPLPSLIPSEERSNSITEEEVVITLEPSPPRFPIAEEQPDDQEGDTSGQVPEQMPEQEPEQVEAVIQPATEPEITVPEYQEAKTETLETVTIVSPDEDEKTPTEQIEIPTVDSLTSNAYYLQIAVYSRIQNAQLLVEYYSPTYPVVVYPFESNTGRIYKVLVGPLADDERGVILTQFKSTGFKDAFFFYNE